MKRRPPRSTRTDTLLPYTRLFRSVAHDVRLHRRFDKRVQPLGIAELDRLGGDVNALLDELQGWQGHMENDHAMLAHRASHDPLTAMPNRAAFDEQLARRIDAAAARGGRFARLFIDADNRSAERRVGKECVSTRRT